MLKHVTTPKKKTDIMYGAHLSYDQLTKYLPLLEEKNLVERSGSRWVISLAGQDYLDAYSTIQELVLR